MRELAENPVIARQLIIRGRVQGVWYRASACTEARRLGVHGWVRNRRDGSVEVHVAGPRAAVEAFIAWAHIGPQQAEVSAVEVGEAAVEALDGFEQRPSA